MVHLFGRCRRGALAILAAFAAAAACATAPGAGLPVHQVGAERRLDLGEVELVLDPTTDARFIDTADRSGDRVTTFHEKDADGNWARLEIHRRPVAAATAARLEADPGLLQREHYLPDRPLQPARTAVDIQAWTIELSHPEGTHHEPNPDGKGHSTVQDLPRYQRMAVLITPTAVITLIYIAELHRPDGATLTLDQILTEGRARHGARADQLLARLRRRR